MKKYIKYFIALIIVGGLLLFSFNKVSIMKVKADSGFDSSYDSGGSWDSGSSWDSDWDSGGSSYSGSSGSLDGFTFFIILVVIIIIIVANSKSGKLININNVQLLDHSKELSEDKIKEIYPMYDKNTFIAQRYKDYLEIQKAWMDFDYDVLRTKVTDELYNQYEMQLDTLKVKNEKNIMKDFTYKDAIITNISNENNQITVTIELVTQFIDYIEKDGSPVRGNSQKHICMHYEMKFVCNLEEKIDKCPNCGADIGNNASKKCEYCGSVISNVSNNWVMSKKEAKGQR